MNTPNKLTVVRIALVPFFLFFLLPGSIPHHYLIAAALFGIASITDAVDGKLARKNNQVTNFGKFLDPLADKILVMAAFVGFVEQGLISSWFVVIMLAREFLVTSLRLVASNSGEVIAANMWGKAKTVSQIVVILVILLIEEVHTYGWFMPCGPFWPIVIFILMCITTLLTVISGVNYVWQNRKYINIKS
ncbi:MAG: CDP-diacylglycerol--glycerol-3-phosphate 3-phosphatidyltransferase [Clostridiales bacterium]|nr:CDP-diacylglycerol--glycerol-3-phosphate 3-phosphatidyltransferase [Clostridiales bacterium]